MVITILSLLIILLSVLPYVQHQHWIFRVGEFIKLQLLPFKLVVFIVAFIYMSSTPWWWLIQVIQAGLIGYHIYLLMRYTKFWRTPSVELSASASKPVKIVSCNIYQFNKEYQYLGLG